MATPKTVIQLATTTVVGEVEAGVEAVEAVETVETVEAVKAVKVGKAVKTAKAVEAVEVVAAVEWEEESLVVRAGEQGQGDPKARQATVLLMFMSQ